METATYDRRAWLPIFIDKLGAFSVYVVALLFITVVLGFFEPKLGGLFLWTVIQGQSSYIGWYLLYGLPPIAGYLPIAVTVSTAHLVACWFTLFRKRNDSGRSFAMKFVYPDRHPRLYRSLREGGYSRLLISGFVPGIWPAGFISLRFQARRFGLATVLSGNALKTATFAVAYEVALSLEYTVLVIVVTAVVLFLTSRIFSQFLFRS